MAEEIVLKVDVELEQGSKSLRSLKEEFKNTQKELDGLTIGSEKYIKTLQKLGGIRDDIGDLNQTINAFNPEGKIQALGGAIGGVASGFQAATAATALFGSESEQLTKQLVKVQAAMALTESIKGIVAMKDSFAVLNAVIAANPIAAATVAVLALTAAVTALVIEQDKELEQLKKLGIEREKLRLKTRNAEIALYEFKRKLQTDELQQTLDLAKARGASETELYNLEKSLIKQRIADISAAKEARGNLTKEEALQQISLRNQLEVLEVSHQKNILDIRKKTAEDKKKLNDDISKLEAEQQAELEADFANKETEAINRENKRRQDKLNADLEANRIWTEQQKKEADEVAAKEKQLNDDKIAAVNYNQQLERDSFMATQALSDIVYVSRLNNVKKGSAEEQKVLKKQFEINKAFQIGNATMNGAQAIQLAWATIPDPTGVTQTIRTAMVAATTIAQIAKIRATKFDSGGGSASAPTASPMSSSQPQATNAPVVNTPTSTNTRLNADGTVRQTQQSQQMIKAVVVESDITQAQKKVANIKDLASFS